MCGYFKKICITTSLFFAVSLAGKAQVSCVIADSIPNVFTPNGDGYNDVFKISPGVLTALHCTIYDRWGVIVNEWHGINGGWDGRTTSGMEAAQGVYYFIAKGNCGDAEVVVNKLVHLLR